MSSTKAASAKKKKLTEASSTEKNFCDEHIHPDHKTVLPRLNRVGGQVRGIQKMVSERRYCIDILVQLRAAMAALRNVELDIFEKHTQSCLVEALESKDKKEAKRKIEELTSLLKRRSII